MESIDRTQELIWGGDFDNQNIRAVVVQRLGINTYGELAQVDPHVLKANRLLDDEITHIKGMLAERGIEVEWGNDWRDH
jgi:hypothetical protein